MFYYQVVVLYRCAPKDAFSSHLRFLHLELVTLDKPVWHNDSELPLAFVDLQNQLVTAFRTCEKRVF
jgi:hypothetical protein